MQVQYVTIGGITIDSVVNAEGRISRQQMGGNAVYAAVGAHFWSPAVGIVGCIPQNYPREWLAALADAGIDTAGVVPMDTVVECAEWFFYQEDGSRVDHLYATLQDFPHSAYATRESLTFAEKQEWMEALQHATPLCGQTFATFRQAHPVGIEHIPAAFWQARAFHLAPEQFTSHLVLARTLRQRHGQVSVDPGRYVHTIAVTTLSSLLIELDAFLPSAKEAYALFPTQSLKEIVAQLANLMSGAVVIKIGNQGSLVWNRTQNKIVHVPAITTTVIDPTGAGDAYCGGFMVGLRESGDPVVAACYGTVSASFVIEGFGALYALHKTRAAAENRLHKLLACVRPALSTGDLP
jgi:ribokinase